MGYGEAALPVPGPGFPPPGMGYDEAEGFYAVDPDEVQYPGQPQDQCEERHQADHSADRIQRMNGDDVMDDEALIGAVGSQYEDLEGGDVATIT
eukprot:gene12416-14669_t